MKSHLYRLSYPFLCTDIASTNFCTALQKQLELVPLCTALCKPSLLHYTVTYLTTLEAAAYERACQVVDMLRRDTRQPLEYTMAITRRYDDLITSKAETDIDQLVESSPSFDEFGHELRRYSSILDDINYNTVKTVRLGVFEVYELCVC